MRLRLFRLFQRRLRCRIQELEQEIGNWFVRELIELTASTRPSPSVLAELGVPELSEGPGNQFFGHGLVEMLREDAARFSGLDIRPKVRAVIRMERLLRA